MLSRFCPLTKTPDPTSTPQYPDRQNTNQNKMQDTPPFSIVLQVLKIFLIKIWQIQPLGLLILVVLYQLLHQQISFFKNFQNFIQHYLRKRFLSQIFLFYQIHSNPTAPLHPHPLNNQRFLSMLPNSLCLSSRLNFNSQSAKTVKCLFTTLRVSKNKWALVSKIVSFLLIC